MCLCAMQAVLATPDNNFPADASISVGVMSSTAPKAYGGVMQASRGVTLLHIPQGQEAQSTVMPNLLHIKRPEVRMLTRAASLHTHLAKHSHAMCPYNAAVSRKPHNLQQCHALLAACQQAHLSSQCADPSVHLTFKVAKTPQKRASWWCWTPAGVCSSHSSGRRPPSLTHRQAHPAAVCQAHLRSGC